MLMSIIMVVVYLFLQMCVIWFLYRFFHNPSIVDSSWSIGLMVSGLIYLFSTSITLRTSIIALLLITWALRLAGYLFLTRLLQGHRDKRYATISSQWKISPALGFFLNFQLQALLIFSISFIFYFIANTHATSFSKLDFIAIAIVMIGVAGESLADLQLHHFKQTQHKKVCDVGLWNYSRHPNYFFDWLTWFGFTLFALRANFGCLSFLSLALLYIIFTRITGPITERGSIESRGAAYERYQEDHFHVYPLV